MIISPLIKAPVAVQLNRAAFIIYTAFFAWPLWAFRHTISASGLVIFGAFVFCSLLGLGYTFVRIRRSRWILALFGLLIPAAFWISMCLIVFSRPAWWEWPFALTLWFSIPLSLVVPLFKDKKTIEYFTTPAA
jgi:hypothetical protein